MDLDSFQMVLVVLVMLVFHGLALVSFEGGLDLGPVQGRNFASFGNATSLVVFFRN